MVRFSEDVPVNEIEVVGILYVNKNFVRHFDEILVKITLPEDK